MSIGHPEFFHEAEQIISEYMNKNFSSFTNVPSDEKAWKRLIMNSGLRKALFMYFRSHLQKDQSQILCVIVGICKRILSKVCGRAFSSSLSL